MSRRTLQYVVLLMAGMLAAPAVAAAGLNSWATGAQEGGTPTSAVLAGSTAYAGFVSGGYGGSLYRSSDSGATWSRVPAIGYREIQGLAIDPAPGGPVYAATRTGVYRSFDGGATWAEIAGTGSGTGGFFTAVAVDRGRPGTAFFARFSISGGGVFRTDADGAAFWDDVGGGLGTYNGLDGIVVDPFTHTAWGWQYGGGVFFLPDGDTTWQPLNNALPSLSVVGLGIDTNSSRVIAATTSGPAWIATSGGTAWQAITAGLSSNYQLSLTVDGAGVAFTTLIDGSISRLGSGATTWTTVTGGLPAAYAPRIVADATVGGHALALSGQLLNPNAGQGPLWRTTDSGLNWTRGGGINAVAVANVAPSPTVAGLVLVATQADAVQRSADGGKTWSASGTGLPTGQVFSVAFDSGTPTTAYAGTNGRGTFRSTDSGHTWTALPIGAPSAAQVLQADPSVPGTIYAASSGSVNRSSNHGDSWDVLPTTGLPFGFYIQAIVPDPAAPGAIYVAGYSGVYHLDNAAASWTARSDGLGAMGVAGISLDAGSTSTLLAATTGGGVFRSTNSGTTWSVATNGIGESFVNDVAFDPLVAGLAYASTSAGVYRTTDGGTTWAPLTGGLALPETQELRFDADDHTLYGATKTVGVVARTRGVAPTVGTPKLKGRAKVGTRLTVTFKVTGFPSPTTAVHWVRCDAAGKHCGAIRGASRTTYQLAAADRGRRLRAIVTVSNALAKVVANSALTGVVA